MKLFF